SHDSPVSTTPLPQTACVQVAPVQDQPGSVRHVLEQPSPLTALPSSQFSVAVITPSPQSGTHFLPGTRHCQPGSTAVQSAAQPSPPTVFPSSQASALASTPSPQTLPEMQGAPKVGQSKSASI